jgi:hypothetical protein
MQHKGPLFVMSWCSCRWLITVGWYWVGTQWPDTLELSRIRVPTFQYRMSFILLGSDGVLGSFNKVTRTLSLETPTVWPQTGWLTWAWLVLCILTQLSHQHCCPTHRSDAYVTWLSLPLTVPGWEWQGEAMQPGRAQFYSEQVRKDQVARCLYIRPQYWEWKWHFRKVSPYNA